MYKTQSGKHAFKKQITLVSSGTLQPINSAQRALMSIRGHRCSRHSANTSTKPEILAL